MESYDLWRQLDVSLDYFRIYILVYMLAKLKDLIS